MFAALRFRVEAEGVAVLQVFCFEGDLVVVLEEYGLERFPALSSSFSPAIALRLFRVVGRAMSVTRVGQYINLICKSVYGCLI